MSKRHHKRQGTRVPAPRLPSHFALGVLGCLEKDLVNILSTSSPLIDTTLGNLNKLKTLFSGKPEVNAKSLVSDVKATTQSIVTQEDLPPHDVAAFLLVSECLRKYPEAFTSIDRVKAALEAFHQADRRCLETSRRLRNAQGTSLSMLESIKKEVRSILGPAPSMADLVPRHGPGVSTQTRKGNTGSYFKYSEFPYHVTESAIPHAKAMISQDLRWLGSLEDAYRQRYDIPPWAILNWAAFWDTVLERVPGSRVTTVPKDGLTDRPICIEPTLNMCLQLSIDDFIKRRLRRFGCDLRDQRRNQALALAGSVSGQLVTIDLSSASDSVSLRLCRLLLDKPWFELMCDVRSPKGELPDGTSLRFAKISSMGNGYTFSLESVIFLAITRYAARKGGMGRSVLSKLLSVYGDDIIAPKSCATTLVEALEFCGFEVNKGKSFVTGPFRESCGSDWYSGHWVRSPYIKDKPSTICDMFHLWNSFAIWAVEQDLYLPHDLTLVFPTLYGYISSRIPEGYRFTGPLQESTRSYLFTHVPDIVGVGCSVVQGLEETNRQAPLRGVNTWFFGRLLASHRTTNRRLECDIDNFLSDDGSCVSRSLDIRELQGSRYVASKRSRTQCKFKKKLHVVCSSPELTRPKLILDFLRTKEYHVPTRLR